VTPISGLTLLTLYRAPTVLPNIRPPPMLPARLSLFFGGEGEVESPG